MKQINLELSPSLENIVEDIKKAGGRSYLVGGAVIDLIQGNPPKDWDIEVYNMELHDLEALLLNHGRTGIVGKSFGIIKTRINHVDYDFNIPRLEIKKGKGHKDFEVILLPALSPEEAALRRDLTINSMFYDLVNRELMDPYGGIKDLEAGILRHTSERFTEDPLRVLRIMQLLPRKGKVVAPETIELCMSLVDLYPTITQERVFEEWNKLLIKSDKPSMGLQFLVDCGWSRWYPELDKLRDVQQHKEWHPEGSVWNHIMMAIDPAASLRQYIPEGWQKSFMYGELLHDVGKAVTTSADMTSYNHDREGVPLARSFMRRLTNEQKLIDQVLKIVEHHMKPGHYVRGHARESKWIRLHNSVPLNVIGYISKADAAGRTGRSLNDPHLPSEKALELYERYGEKKMPPILNGRDLISVGYEPGPVFKGILDKAYTMQVDEGITDKNTLLKMVKLMFHR